MANDLVYVKGTESVPSDSWPVRSWYCTDLIEEACKAKAESLVLQRVSYKLDREASLNSLGACLGSYALAHTTMLGCCWVLDDRYTDWQFPSVPG